jgi:hypothetical protein
VGKYAPYLSDKYTTEDQIEKLLAKYATVIDKYHPELGEDNRVMLAKNIEHISLKEWLRQEKLKVAARKQRALANAFKASPGPLTLAKYLAYRATSGVTDFAEQSADFAACGRGSMPTRTITWSGSKTVTCPISPARTGNGPR